MIAASMKDSIQSLKNGNLIIINDDVLTFTSYFMGLAEKATPKTVNDMIKIGKGLTYVCIPESNALQLNLPLMVREDENTNNQHFTVSIDHKSTTTGISAFERAQTIKSLTKTSTKANDLNKPGHVFPLIGKDRGLLQRVNIVEASIDLATLCSSVPIAYISEILNDFGEIATEDEIKKIARTHGFNVVNLSDILIMKSDQVIYSFSAKVIKGNQIGRKIGFPTANLDMSETNVKLNRGAYGVKVRYDHTEYLGMMSVGIRPTIYKEEEMYHYEVHLFDFNKEIYGDVLKVDVCFYIREETSFPSVDHLVEQLQKDKTNTLKRFNLLKANV